MFLSICFWLIVAVLAAPECLADLCENGGTCVVLDHSFGCHCVDGYVGYFCSKSIVCKFLYLEGSCTI